MPTVGTSLPFLLTDGGLQFRDVKAEIATVTDNGVDPDDDRVIKRLNQATKIAMTGMPGNMMPVGCIATYNVAAVGGFLALPPQLENCIEAYPLPPTSPTGIGTKVRADSDITQAWYEIVGNAGYLDPNQQHDNPLIDLGLKPDATDQSVLRRVYEYPGLQPSNAVVVVTGKRRFIPVKSDDDYLIVQNVEALKYIILSIERNENSQPDEAPKYLNQAFELLRAEVQSHLLDPRNYARRKSAYFDDITNYPEGTLGWMRANIAIDVEDALRTGKQDLTWSINQVEKRIMQRGTYKDCVIQIQAEVTGGIVYLPINVLSVLAVDLCSSPIPIRSQFFQHLENGPGMFPSCSMLIDQGDSFLPGTNSRRRKYKLVADCTASQTINMVCKLRHTTKKPEDFMVIKNYEAIRLLMTAKFLEEKENWQAAAANQQSAFQLMEAELREYLGGIRHTVHVQTSGFSLGDVGGTL